MFFVSLLRQDTEFERRRQKMHAEHADSAELYDVTVGASAFCAPESMANALILSKRRTRHPVQSGCDNGQWVEQTGERACQ